MSKRFLIVGAGFSGAVLARELVSRIDCEVRVVDQRSHIGGNCHTARDEATGVMVHSYGPHIFNTSDERVWSYVNEFGRFHPFVNRVKASTSRGVFSMPINLHTINQFYGTRMTPDEAKTFIAEKGDSSITEPKNFEEQALKFLGRELYEAFFYGYTLKQWGCEPRELPAAILKRLPVRFSYDDNYYDKTWQGIPEEGYSEVIARILDHSRIDVRLNEKISALSEAPDRHGFDHLFYTGPIDGFFNYSLGRLSYRTVTFEKEVACGDFQGTAAMNYPDQKVPFTRITEHKHFAPWESHEKTVIFREYSKETTEADVPYYPKRLDDDLVLLRKYRELAENTPGVGFLGRLATYRYMDMERVIAEALSYAVDFAASSRAGTRPPTFPNVEK